MKKTKKTYFFFCAARKKRIKRISMDDEKNAKKNYRIKRGHQL